MRYQSWVSFFLGHPVYVQFDPKVMEQYDDILFLFLEEYQCYITITNTMDRDQDSVV